VKAAPTSVGGPLLRKAPPPGVAGSEPPVKAAPSAVGPAAGEQLLRKAPPPGIGAERPTAKAAPPGVGGWGLPGGEPAVKAPPCSAEAPAACGAGEAHHLRAPPPAKAPPAGVVS